MIKNLIKRINKMPTWHVASWLVFFSFIYFFLLAYHFPWMWTEDMCYLRETFSGFHFPPIILITRITTIFLYQCIFYLFGFNYFYFHLLKVIMATVFMLFYYLLVAKLLGKIAGVIASLLILFSSPFVFTTIFIAEPITVALLLQILIIYLLLCCRDNLVNYVIIFLMILLALFSKETNLVILPLLVYYFLFHEKGINKFLAFVLAFFLISYMLFYKLFAYMRPTTFDLFNLNYFAGVLLKYYAVIGFLIVLGFIVCYFYQKLKLRNIFLYDKNTFLVIWFILCFVMLLFGHNQEERYIVEIIPVFTILLIKGVDFFSKTYMYKRYKKITRLFFILAICGFVIINCYGIIKTEFGWGSIFKGFEQISKTVEKEYPDSLLTYQSRTQDFFSDFRNFEVKGLPSHITDSVLQDLYKNKSKYTKVLYVRYPCRIRVFKNEQLDKFNSLFKVKQGIYEFEVFELKNES